MTNNSMTNNSMTNTMTNQEFISTDPQTEQLTDLAATADLAAVTEPAAAVLQPAQIAAMASDVRSLFGSQLPPEIAATLLLTSPHLALRRNYRIRPSKEQLLELGFAPEVVEQQPLLLASILGGTQWVVELPISGIDTKDTPPSVLPTGLPACVDWHIGYNDAEFGVDRPLVLTDRVSVADLFSTRGYGAMTLLGAERWHGAGGAGPNVPEGLEWVECRHIYFALSCDLHNTPYLRKAINGLLERMHRLKACCSLYKMQLPLMPDGTPLDYNDYFLRGGTVDLLVSNADTLL